RSSLPGRGGLWTGRTTGSFPAIWPPVTHGSASGTPAPQPVRSIGTGPGDKDRGDHRGDPALRNRSSFAYGYGRLRCWGWGSGVASASAWRRYERNTRLSRGGAGGSTGRSTG